MAEGRVKDGFSGPAAARITGIPYSTIHYWDRTGLVRPSIAQARGTGSRRVYSFVDLIALRTVDLLRQRGLSLQALRKAVKKLREYAGQSAQPNEVLARHLLLTDGKDVYVVGPGDRRVVLSLLREGQMVLAIWLGKVAKDIANAAERERPVKQSGEAKAKVKVV